MNPDLIASINESVLCWLATVDNAGIPNVSPKEVFTHYENEIIIGNIASPESAQNVRLQSHACVSFINIFTQKGYKVKGAAELLTKGSDGFDERFTVLSKMAGDKFPIMNVFSIHIDEFQEIIAPSYRLYPETTEQSQIESAYRTYGVTNRD